MTARCGSMDPAHRSKTCRPCDKLYKARYERGEPRFRFRVRANAAICAICSIAAGNSLGVAVYRYPLRAWRGGGQRSVASIGLCDSCIIARGEVRAPRRKAA